MYYKVSKELSTCEIQGIKMTRISCCNHIGKASICKVGFF